MGVNPRAYSRDPIGILITRGRGSKSLHSVAHSPLLRSVRIDMSGNDAGRRRIFPLAVRRLRQVAGLKIGAGAVHDQATRDSATSCFGRGAGKPTPQGWAENTLAIGCPLSPGMCCAAGLHFHRRGPQHMLGERDGVRGNAVNDFS